ncbi:hypothetical protein LTR10_015108 [Elasticomyces elasticus]|nr:hypothetical protein LTR10_015108 [Elasticomyces elasticus]
MDHDEQYSASPEDLDTEEDSDSEPTGNDSMSENEHGSTESFPISKAAFIGSLSSTEKDGEARGVQYQFDQTQWDTVLTNSIRQHQQQSSLLLDKPPSLELGVSFPFSSEPTSSLDSLLAALPPRRHRDYLVNQYFACFSPLLHVLHDPTFMADYVSFNRNPRAVKLSWLALLFTLLALAVTTLDEHDPLLQDLCLQADGGDGMKILAKKYRTGAMNALAADSFLVRHHLTTLQVLILLIYAINHSMTLNIAIAMGCHVDPEVLKITDRLEAEQRRRCWAGLVMLHMLQIVSFGNVDVLHLKDFQVELPADANDIDILPDRILTVSNSPTQMSYMLFKLRVHGLAVQISEKLFRGTGVTIATVMAIDSAIVAEQQKWDDRYLADGGSNLLPHHHQAHWNILHMYAHQLYLLLHRPFFHMQEDDPWPESRARCVTSGKALLDIHQLLCETRHFARYRWYVNGLGSFYAFHGAVIIFAALFGESSGATKFEYGAAFLACVTRFERLASQSHICAQALHVLQHLQ